MRKWAILAGVVGALLGGGLAHVFPDYPVTMGLIGGVTAGLIGGWLYGRNVL